MQQLKVGIIGYGRSGRDIHTCNLKKHTDLYQIAAVCDIDEARRTMAASELGVPTYDNFSEMIRCEALDLVVNATFSYLHTSITKELLSHGLTVLCEKPAASTVADLDEVLQACPQENRLFFFQQSRFAPYFQKLKQVISSGVIGELIQVSAAFNGFSRRWDWQTLQSFMAGNLLNTGPHPMDQLLDLFGGGPSDIPEVFCAMNRAVTFGDAEDYVKVLMRGQSHVVFDLEISSCCAYPCFTYNVQGTRGGIKSTADHMEWKYFLPEKAAEQQVLAAPMCDKDGFPAYCSEQITWQSGEWNFSEEPQIQNAAYSSQVPANFSEAMVSCYYETLYDTLVHGADFPVKHWQVRRQIQVMEECHRQNNWMWKNYK